MHKVVSNIKQYVDGTDLLCAFGLMMLFAGLARWSLTIALAVVGCILLALGIWSIFLKH